MAELRYYDHKGYKNFADVDAYKFCEQITRMVNSKKYGGTEFSALLGAALAYCVAVPIEEDYIKIELWLGNGRPPG